MKKNTFSLQARALSFCHAFSGLKQLFKEPNMRIHIIATVAVIAAGIIRNIHRYQWMAILVSIALVWITEAFNTCVEMLCDYACDNKWHPVIKTIKDISAAAVLIAAILSVVVGTIIFISYLYI